MHEMDVICIVSTSVRGAQDQTADNPPPPPPPLWENLPKQKWKACASILLWWRHEIIRAKPPLDLAHMYKPHAPVQPWH